MDSCLQCSWLATSLTVLLGTSITSNGQPIWVEQGPGPATVLNCCGYTQVSGAIEAIAADPVNANRVFVAAVNGGIWRSDNAAAANPTWIPLTDHLPSLSMGAIAFSPLDQSRNTLFAGFGQGSHGGPPNGSNHGPLLGLLKTTDGGNTWTELARNVFSGQGVTRILPTAINTPNGPVIIVSTWFYNSRAGIWRSADGGQSWAQLCGADGSHDGIDNDDNGLIDEPGELELPAAPIDAFDLVSDPGNPQRIYCALANGVHRSDDGGQRWTDITRGLTGVTPGGYFNIRLAISPGVDGIGRRWLFASVSGIGIFRSTDNGATWTIMEQPPDGSHFAGPIVVSPANATIVFSASDSGTPNHWRGNGIIAGGGQWYKVDGPNAGGTGPHTDIRDWVFSADGTVMFEADDGGVYRLRNPSSLSPRWESAIGNLRVTEFLSVGYDTLNNVLFGACWDNSIPHQTVPGSIAWGANERFSRDGIQVGVDNTSTPGASIHYSSQQSLFEFIRRTYTSPTAFTEQPVQLLIRVGPNQYSGNNFVEGALTPDDDNDLGTIDFIQPWRLNAVDGRRLLIGTDYLYESSDRGDHFESLGGIGQNRLGQPIPINPVGKVRSYAYGHPQNADIFYVGTVGNAGGHLLWLRSSGTGYPAPLDSYQNAGGSNPYSMVMDPNDWHRLYVVDNQGRLWRTTDAGSTIGGWINLTGNLGSLSTDPRVIEVFSPTARPDEQALLVGGFGGVFVLRNPSAAGTTAVWERLGDNLPNVIVTDLHYYRQDDVLVAGTYGRGAWTMPNTGRAIFPNDCFLDGNVLKVGPTGPFLTVRAAYNAAQSCNRILIFTGTYSEGPITMNKYIRLESQGGPATIR